MTSIKSKRKYSSKGLFHKQQMALYFAQKRRRLGAQGTDVFLGGSGTSASVSEDATIGTVVGLFEVIRPNGSYNLVLTDDAGGLFVLNGDNLEVAGALDYETTQVHVIEITADNGMDPVITKNFAIQVIDVVEFVAPSFNFSINTNSQYLPLV